MKILIATKETQGRRKNDFFFAEVGEPVSFPSECDGEEVDGGCGCRRSMSGMNSRKGTTTMQVIELKITKAQYMAKIKESLKNGGWLDIMKKKDVNKWVEEQANELIDMAGAFNDLDIVERRGDTLKQRRLP